MAALYTPPQIRRLVPLIEQHFTTQRLDQAVFIGLKRTLQAITRAPTLEEMIFEVCQVANREGRMTELLQGLKATNEFQELHAAFDRFEATGSYENTDPFATLLVTEAPPIPVVNRQSLRECLRDLTKLKAGYGVISVDGPRACGKTHSKSLIRYVADWKGARTVVIDVVNDTRALTLRETINKITDLLTLPVKDLERRLKDQPTDAQTAERFVNWISGLSESLTADGRQYWVLFDGLNHDAADPVRKYLLPPLLQAIADGNVLGVKAFLLGYDATRIADASHIALHENARGIVETEIGAFLTAFAAKKGWALSQEDHALLLSYVLGGAQSPFDHKALQGIRERLGKILSLLENPIRALKELQQVVQ
jgi:hypothetical protein